MHLILPYLYGTIVWLTLTDCYGPAWESQCISATIAGKCVHLSADRRNRAELVNAFESMRYAVPRINAGHGMGQPVRGSCATILKFFRWVR